MFWNRLYDPSTRERDTRIKQALRSDGLRCDSSNGALLFEPWEIRNRAGEPYRVFSAFWRACLDKLPGIAAEPAPSNLPEVPSGLSSLSIDSLGLMPRVRWDEGLAERWATGGGRGPLPVPLDFSTSTPLDTASGATSRPSPAPRASRRTCTSARSARGGSSPWRQSASEPSRRARRRRSFASWAGASSPTT